MGAVALDATVVIGALEPRDAHHDDAVRLLELHEHDPAVISASAYGECLVAPLRRGEDWRVDGMLSDGAVELVPIDRGIARRAAELRVRHRSLRLPDALVLATALARDAELLTFDDRMRRIMREERA